jgi:hypothetical protein
MLARLVKLNLGNIAALIVCASVSISALALDGCAGYSAARNADSSSASGSSTLSLATSSLPGGTIGAAYSATLQATGGTASYSWSITAGSLPVGLSLNASSGAISGTPTTSGTSTFTVQVKDANSNTATKSLSIAIAASVQPLTITTTSVPNGSTNTAYSAFLFAGGGTTPYTWSISSGSLPTGMTLSSAGDITGVPTTAGTSSFTAKVTDSSSPVQTATANYGVTIAQGTAYSVALAWTASPSSGVTGYNVYRSTVTGNDYTKINSSPVTGLSYVDGTVLDGTTYYYVFTAVDSAGDESGYSTQVQMVIP